MSAKNWQRRFEAQVVPLLDSAETLWNEIGVSDEQRDKVLQRSAADQRNFFEAIVADARLLRDRLLQENALLDNELKSLGSELKLAIPARPARATLSESHEWFSREVARVQAERARRNRQFLVQFAEYTFLRGLLDERGDTTLLEAYRDCVASRVRVANESDTRKLAELVAELRAERAARMTECEALRNEVNELVSQLEFYTSQRIGENDDVEALLADEFLRDLLAFDVRSVKEPNFEEFVSKRLADTNGNHQNSDETMADGNATMSFLRREQSIAIGDELQTLPYLAVANLLTLRDARDRLAGAAQANRERCDALKRAIDCIWNRLDVPLETRAELVEAVGGDGTWQNVTLLRNPNTNETRNGVASRRVRATLELALHELESAKRAQIPRIVERIRADLVARWSALHFDCTTELAGLNAYLASVCPLPDPSRTAHLSETERIVQWCAYCPPDSLLDAHERAEAGWADWLATTERVHERVGRWVEVFKRLVYCETDARRDPDYTTNRGGFILKLQKEVASHRKELSTLERTIATLIAEYDALRQSALEHPPAEPSFAQQLLASRSILVMGKPFADFSAEQMELLEAAKREFAASFKKGGTGNVNVTNVAPPKGSSALLRLDSVAEDFGGSATPTTPKKRGAAPASAVTPSKRGRLGAAPSVANLGAPNSRLGSTAHNSTASSYSSCSTSRTNLTIQNRPIGQSQLAATSTSNLRATNAKPTTAANQSRMPAAANSSRLLAASQAPLPGMRANSAAINSTARMLAGTQAQRFTSRLPLPTRLNAARSRLPTQAMPSARAAAFVMPRSPSPDGGRRTIRVQEQRAKALNSKRRSRSFTDLRELEAEPMMVDEMTVVQESSMDSLGGTPLGFGTAHVNGGNGVTPIGMNRGGVQRMQVDGATRIQAAPSMSTLASMSSGLGSSACTTSTNITAFRTNAGVQTSITSTLSSALGDDRSSLVSASGEDCSFGAHGANSTKIDDGDSLLLRSGDFSVSKSLNAADSSNGIAARGQSGSFLI